MYSTAWRSADGRDCAGRQLSEGGRERRDVVKEEGVGGNRVEQYSEQEGNRAGCAVGRGNGS